MFCVLRMMKAYLGDDVLETVIRAGLNGLCVGLSVLGACLIIMEA